MPVLGPRHPPPADPVAAARSDRQRSTRLGCRRAARRTPTAAMPVATACHQRRLARAVLAHQQGHARRHASGASSSAGGPAGIVSRPAACAALVSGRDRRATGGWSKSTLRPHGSRGRGYGDGMASPFVEIEVDNRVVKVTNPDRVYFPAERGDQARPGRVLPRRRARASSTRSSSGRACCTASRPGCPARRSTRSGCRPGAPTGSRPSGCTSRAGTAPPTSCASPSWAA